jgi:hypothetical protein
VLVYLTPRSLDSPDPNTLSGGYDPPGDKQTSLRITGAAGDVPTLETHTETTLTFDVATRTFG